MAEDKDSKHRETSFARTNPELRARQLKALRQYHREFYKQLKEWIDEGCPRSSSAPVTFPEICRDMKCEAKTRGGWPCKNDGTWYANGRCKFHGGASTGPKTKDGKRASAKNGFKQSPCDPE
jgi:hypothetical protein